MCYTIIIHMSRKTHIKYIHRKISYLDHEQLVQVLHIIRPSVDVKDLIEKDNSVLMYYDKMNDDLIGRIYDYVKKCTSSK